MASGRRSHMPKPFGPFGAGPPYARPAPPTRSFYAPCLPSKRALPKLTTDPRPSAPAPGVQPADEPPLYPPPANPLLPLHPTLLLAQKPLLTPLDPATPSPRLPLPPSFPHCHTVMYPTRSPERGGRTRGPHPSPRTIFMVRYEPDRRKVRIIF